MLCFVLGSCGSGSSSPVSLPPPPDPSTVSPPPPQINVNLHDVTIPVPLTTPETPAWLTRPGDTITEALLQNQQGYAHHPELSAINALKAHTRDALGAGAWIGIADLPVNLNAPNLQGITVLDPQVTFRGHRDYQPGSRTEAELVAYNADYMRAYTLAEHGTTVARIAAGRFDGRNLDNNLVGVAPQAGLAVYGLSLGSSSGSNYSPIDLSSSSIRFDATIERLVAVMSTEAQVDIANFSFGVEGLITNPTYQGTGDYAAVRAALPRTLGALAQADRTTKTVFVFSAGNPHGLTYPDGTLVDANAPELLSGLPLVDPGLQGHVIAVVATQPADPANRQGPQVISEYSSRCGAAAAFCIAAPGDVRLHISGPSVPHYPRGTSFAAPRVSGALAVLVGQVKTGGSMQMSMQQLVQRLYSTARDTGTYSDQAIYGHGLLDLDAALSPVGQMSMATGDSLDGQLHAFQSSWLAAGPATGDALARAFAGRTVTLFDDLEFPFPAALPEVLDTEAAPRAWERAMLLDLERLAPLRRAHRLSTWHTDWHTRATGRFSALAPGARGAAAWFGAGDAHVPLFPGGWADLGGHLDLMGQAAGVGYSRSAASLELRAALFAELRNNGHAGTGVVAQLRPAAWGPAAARSARLTLGLLQRDEYLLDTRGSEGFALSGSKTLFAGFGGDFPLGRRWWLFYGAALGYTRPRAVAGSAWRAGGAPLLSTEGELGIGGRHLWRADDRIGLRLHQPLRVERGTMEVGYALYRTPGRLVHREVFEASLEPSGRQLSLEGIYRLPLARNLETGLLLRWSRQPRHVRSAAGEFAFMSALRLQW